MKYEFCRPSKWIRGVAAMGIAAILVAAPAAAETIRIGMLNSLTGSHATFDLPAREGVLMAVGEINKNGGVVIDGNAMMLAQDLTAE